MSALVPYKRLDVAIDACRQAGVPLRIVGTGPEQERLEALAQGRVEFLGWQSNEQIRELYRSSTATLLPGTEDFGIVPVESQACGTPVVALDAGGARETVLDGRTGVLVGGPSAAAFADGLQRVMRTSFDTDAIRHNAERFSRANFIAAFTRAVDEAIADKAQGGNADLTRWGPQAPPVFPETWPPPAESSGTAPIVSAGSPEPAVVDFDAATVPPASVQADRENKK